MLVAQIAKQLRELGARDGGVLCVHTSFRAVRPVDGGPAGLVEALRRAVGPQGTLVMPTMTAGDAPFDPASTPTVDMGIVAETFWRLPGVVRSTHPGASFAAVGPRAEAICAAQPLSPPHGLDSPIGRVFELEGQILLLGVTHGENTALHLAESLLPVPYSVSHPCVVDLATQGGTGFATLPIAESDHCCAGFGKMDGWLRSLQLQSEGLVGQAHARLMSARDLVSVALARLRDAPLVFLCEKDTGCEECDAAHASVTRPGRA